MNSLETFLWHDYETFGARPMHDRPAQFAAQRTNADLEPVGDPVSWFCKPSDDLLPHPAACMVTGITPQKAQQEGVIETEFAKQILQEMMRVSTCTAGYNSIRFDDVITRNLLYRNLRDPYEREYKNGNSRWDIIDLARMCYALRPDGIKWAFHEPTPEGTPKPSFRLEDLTRENGIQHEGAHEALSDVHATINLARLLKNAQPRLYEWALSLRDQKTVMRVLDPVNEKPILHTSARIPAIRGCTSLEFPLCILPDRPKSVVAFDLMSDPTPLIVESAATIADLVFTPKADLPEGIERMPLKLIHSNHVPMVAPAATLREADPARIRLDPDRCMQHAEQLRNALPAIRQKVIEVFSRPYSDSTDNTDPDQMLYTGGFFSASDKHLMHKILAIPPADLSGHVWTFMDSRLPLMLFRYRARNFPQTLSVSEMEAWDKDRIRRLITPEDSSYFGYQAFMQAISECRESHHNDANRMRMMDELESWAQHTGITRLWQQHADSNL